MRLLLANVEPYLPEVIGGGHLTMHQLSLQFLASGHECRVLAGLGPRRRAALALKRRLRGGPPYLKDQDLGYTTVRMDPCQVRDALPIYARETRTDLVSVQGQGREWLAHAAVSAGIPTMLQTICVEDVEQLRQTAQTSPEFARTLHSPLLKVISNSRFIADRVAESVGLESPVVYPLIRFDEYRVEKPEPEYITLINPHWQKGVELALRVAALLPHRRFLLVESWPLPARSYIKLRARLLQLPNIKLRKPSLNMREVYAKTALLLMPSLTQEAFGRVAVEAALNGIPTVASRVGGIPEAVGEGGILLNPFDDAPEVWASRIDRVLSDQSEYLKLSHSALINSLRPEFESTTIAAKFLEIAAKHVSQNRPGTLTPWQSMNPAPTPALIGPR